MKRQKVACGPGISEEFRVDVDLRQGSALSQLRASLGRWRCFGLTALYIWVERYAGTAAQRQKFTEEYRLGRVHGGKRNGR